MHPFLAAILLGGTGLDEVGQGPANRKEQQQFGASFLSSFLARVEAHGTGTWLRRSCRSAVMRLSLSHCRRRMTGPVFRSTLLPSSARSAMGIRNGSS